MLDSLQSLSLDQIPTYLLKTKSSPSDAYEEYISALDNGKFKPLFVPVLDHIYRHDALRALRLAAERFAFAAGSEADARRKATNNPAKRYGGIVFTSQRAIDAFATVVAKLDPDKITAMFDKDMPIYVVGPATAQGVKALGLPCPVVGQDTGNGETLANTILDWHKTLSEDVSHLHGRKLPLLFLVGEQRRDIIPKALQSDEVHPSDRIPLQEVVVYETGEMAMFEEEITLLTQQAKSAGIKEQWIVVFSPQGCEAVLGALGWLDPKTARMDKALREAASTPMRTYIATIGPTTKDFLIQEFDLDPDVCAVTPSPEGVGQAIARFRKA